MHAISNTLHACHKSVTYSDEAIGYFAFLLVGAMETCILAPTAICCQDCMDASPKGLSGLSL